MKTSAILLLLCLLPSFGLAASTRSLVAQGNEFYIAGQYDKALKAYEEAGVEQPESAPIYFNKGNAYFSKGDYDKAREAYEAAALRTKDLSLEAKAQYNLGNTAFFEAQKQSDSDLRKALEQYEESILHYQEALRINPELNEAAANIEVVRLRIKDLLDQIKKQEEEAKEQQKKQEELLKQLREAIQEQEGEIKANEALKKKVQEDRNAPLEEAGEKLASDQNKTREKTQGISEKLKNPNPQQQEDPAKPIREHLDQAVQEQDSATQKIRDRSLDEAKPHQEKALEQLKQAEAKLAQSQKDRQQSEQDQASSEKADQKQQEQQNQQAQQAQSQPQSDEGRKDESAQKQAAVQAEDAGDILQEEKENRMDRERAVRGGYQPVDRDW